MMKSKTKAITAVAIVLALTIGGVGLRTSQLANAAEVDSGGSALKQSQTAQTNEGQASKGRGGKRSGFDHVRGLGMTQIKEQLQKYLELDEAALKSKLETTTLAELAAEQGKTRAELKAKLVEWLNAAQAEASKIATTDGSNQGAEADAQIKPDNDAAAERLLDSKGFELGKHGGLRGFGGEGKGFNSDAVAKVLGVTSDELKTAMKAGKTLAALAVEKGVKTQAVIDVLVSASKEKLDEQLAVGKITKEQLDTKLAEAADRAAKQVSGELPTFGGGKEGRGERGDCPGGTATTDDEAAAKAEATAPTA